MINCSNRRNLESESELKWNESIISCVMNVHTHRVRVLLQGLTVDLIVTHLIGDNTDKSSRLSHSHCESQSQYIMLLGMVWM